MIVQNTPEATSGIFRLSLTWRRQSLSFSPKTFSTTAFWLLDFLQSPSACSFLEEMCVPFDGRNWGKPHISFSLCDYRQTRKFNKLHHRNKNGNMNHIRNLLSLKYDIFYRTTKPGSSYAFVVVVTILIRLWTLNYVKFSCSWSTTHTLLVSQREGEGGKARKWKRIKWQI